MAEVLVFSSSKDSCGIGVLDVATGSSVGSNFKNCIADAGTMCSLGISDSSYSGRGSGGDYIAVSQSKKPLVHIWQWGKPQPFLQCHVQEIITSLGSDSTGTYLIGGTQKGWIHCWNASTGELINMWQAHLKDIVRIYVTKNNQYIVSASDDGTIRVWETSKVLDISERIRTGNIKSNTLPFRSWCKHSQSVKDMYVLDSLGVFRVISVGLDKGLVIYDVFASTVVLQTFFPNSLESVTCNPGLDVICLGASNGSVYVVDITSLSIGVTAANSKIAQLGLNPTSKKSTTSGMVAAMVHSRASSTPGSLRPDLDTLTPGGLPKGASILDGHTKAVSSLCFSVDNSTLVSASEDGTLRWWNVWTRQCIRETKALNNCAITNAMIVSKPESLNTGLVKPYLAPVQHLRKYMEQPVNYTTDPNGHPTMVLGASLMSNHDIHRNGGVGMTTEVYVELKRTSKAISQSVEEADSAALAVSSHEVKEGAVDDEPVAKKQKQSRDANDKKKGKSSGADLGDFVSFSSSTNDVNEDSEVDQEEVISDLQVQLQLAQEKVALLEEQNMRWEEICKQLKNHIANGEEQDDEEEEEEEESEEEVVEVPAKKQKKAAAAPARPPAPVVNDKKRPRK